MLLTLEQLKSCSAFMGSSLGEDGIAEIGDMFSMLTYPGSRLNGQTSGRCLLFYAPTPAQSGFLSSEQGSEASGAGTAVLGSSPFQLLLPTGSC